MMDPRETLLMATRAGRPEHSAEAEPVLVRQQGDETLLILDDGERLVFDTVELMNAMGHGVVRALRAAA